MGRVRVLALGGMGLSGLLAFVACFLLPERLAVNAPLAHLIFGSGRPPPESAAFGGRIRVPPGFQVGLYAAVPRARMLRFTPAGDLLVSVPREGRVVRLLGDADGDGRADGSETLLEGLDRPHGLDLYGKWLYVAESGAVGRIGFDAETGQLRGDFERVVTGLPAGGNHWTRTLRFGADERMYVSVGSNCNVCEESEPRRAALLRFQPDGSQPEIFATGLRNSVGFDWRPDTGALYATDNGRDLLGDDFPPCELNRIERGGFYGWPYANGDRIPDPDLGAGREAAVARSIPPVHGFPAHNAPLGMHFLRGRELPADYRGAALVALHGSWNRTRKDGYKVVSLHFPPEAPAHSGTLGSPGTLGTPGSPEVPGELEQRDFLWGFLEDEDVIGRPVDVSEGPDGAIYVSDDYAGAIYRITRTGMPPSEAQPIPAARPGAGLGGIPDAELREARRRGEALYAKHGCASCHEAERVRAGAIAVPLSGLAGRYGVETLSAFLAAPTPPMPALPLSAAQRRDLAIALLAAD